MSNIFRPANSIKWVAIFTCFILLFASSSIAFAFPQYGSQAWMFSSTQSSAANWEVVSSPTANNLWSVAFSSPDSGWAGGFNVFLRYDGTSWQVFSVPALGTEFMVQSISMTSDTNGWLVGSAKKANPYYETVILHWDGAQWNEVVSPTSFALMSVWSVDDNNLYTAGGGTLCAPSCTDLLGYAFHWNGSSWASTDIGAHRRVQDVGMVGNSDGWMVGDEVNTSTNQYKSLIMHWVNGAWQSVTSPSIFDNRLYAVSALDANHAWAIGLFDTIMWNGSAWSVVPNPTPHGLYDVQAMSANDAWVVGEMGTILHWDGVSWTLASSPTAANLNGVTKASPFDVWAVGASGTILHYKLPNLALNHSNGAPGSYFNLSIRNFAPNQSVEISVNGHVLQSVSTDAQGNLTATLSTSGIEAGTYILNAAAGSIRAAAVLHIDNGAPTIPQEGSHPTYPIPSGIGFAYSTYLPAIVR